MSNENNQEQNLSEGMQAIQNALHVPANDGEKAMKSEEQVKQSQMTEESPKHDSSSITGSDSAANMQTENSGAQNPGNSDGKQSFEDYLAKFQPHQQRVVVEAKELGQKAYDLRVFIAQSPIFKDLYAEEKEALKTQLFHMEQYFGVLQQRISVWEGGKWNQTKGKELIGDFGVDNEAVFTLKYLASLYIDATNVLGADPRRNNIVATDMEKVQMMAVKSVFSKRV